MSAGQRKQSERWKNMKRAKDKYMINRTKYKDIKRYDHKQMEDFLTDVYKNGYADGKESVPGV